MREHIRKVIDEARRSPRTASDDASTFFNPGASLGQHVVCMAYVAVAMHVTQTTITAECSL